MMEGQCRERHGVEGMKEGRLERRKQMATTRTLQTGLVRVYGRQKKKTFVVCVTRPEYPPKSGITSDVEGMLSMMTIMKTVIASSTVTARLTFSPLSGGTQNVISPMAVSSIQGKRRLYI